MNTSILLTLLFVIKALDAEKSLAFFTPTGEYLPSADFSKFFPGTSERRPVTVDDVKRVLIRQKLILFLRRQCDAKTPKKKNNKERELKQLNIKNIGENVEITVDNMQEARNLIKKFNKLGFTGGEKAKVVKKNKKRQKQSSENKNSNQKKKSKKKIKIILVKNKSKK